MKKMSAQVEIMFDNQFYTGDSRKSLESTMHHRFISMEIFHCTYSMNFGCFNVLDFLNCRCIFSFQLTFQNSGLLWCFKVFRWCFFLYSNYTFIYESVARKILRHASGPNSFLMGHCQEYQNHSSSWVESGSGPTRYFHVSHTGYPISHVQYILGILIDWVFI